MPSGVNRAKKREFREREEITCKMHELHYPSPSCVHPSSPPLLPGVPSTSPVICPLLLSPWWKLKYSLITGDTEAQPLAGCDRTREDKLYFRVFVFMCERIRHLQVCSLSSVESVARTKIYGLDFSPSAFLLSSSSPSRVLCHYRALIIRL